MIRKSVSFVTLCLILSSVFGTNVMADEMQNMTDELNGSVITEPVVGIIVGGTVLLLLIAIISVIIVKVMKKPERK